MREKRSQLNELSQARSLIVKVVIKNLSYNCPCGSFEVWHLKIHWLLVGEKWPVKNVENANFSENDFCDFDDAVYGL